MPAAGVYVGRAAEKTPLPYAVLAVRLVSTELTAGRLFLQTFEAAVDGYTQETPSAGSVQAATILAFLGPPDDPAAGLTLASGRVVHSVLAAGDGTGVTQVRLDGADINKVSTRFTILTQTSR